MNYIPKAWSSISFSRQSKESQIQSFLPIGLRHQRQRGWFKYFHQALSLLSMMLILPPISISQTPLSPIPIPIVNPSFEAAVPFVQDSCGMLSYPVPWWTAYPVPGSAGAAADVRTASSGCDFSPPPDGKQMVELYEAGIYQDVGDAQTNGVYRLRFFVANYFYWYRGHYSASLSLKQGNAAITLCSTSGWGTGDFTEVTLICPEQRGTGRLVITLESSGAQTFIPDYPGVPTTLNYQMLFDNVSLTYTPSN